MIKTIQSSSPSILVSYNSPPFISGGGQSAGMMRFNLSTQLVEVYDGSAWINMSQQVYISLGTDIEATLRWCGNKMQEEKTIIEMAEKHKAVATALENLNKAQEQLAITLILSKEAQ